jgi:tRNA(Arg) A34 adenosine deaminase TadA
MSLSRNELKWLSYAVDTAHDAHHRQWKVGAVLVRSGRIVAIGQNKYRNNPALVEHHNVSYHAEEVAIRRAGNAEGATIYVARLTRSGKIGTAKPCKRCQQALLDNGVTTAIWTEPFGWAKQRLSRLAYEQVSGARTSCPAEVHPLLG